MLSSMPSLLADKDQPMIDAQNDEDINDVGSEIDYLDVTTQKIRVVSRAWNRFVGKLIDACSCLAQGRQRRRLRLRTKIIPLETH